MKLTLLIAIFLLVGNAFAQEKLPRRVVKGHKAYENFSYYKAIEYYTGYEDEFIEVKRNKALSLWLLNEVAEAEQLFKEIVASDGHTNEDLYCYAALLRENKKYADSEIWLRRYGDLNKEDSRSIMHFKENGSYRRLVRFNRDFQVQHLKMNSKQQDFGAVYYKNKVVFVSSREGVKSVRRKWNGNRLPFLDIYVADVKQNNELANPVLLSQSINQKYHEGPVAFNQDGNFMIFTRNNYDEKSSEGITRLQLFSSRFRDGKWDAPVPLPFNDPEYSVGHATISSDGKMLYFASNMPGGIGGVDIYRAVIYPDGTYGEPINMGDKINTEGDEMFPFIHNNGEMLFFSSNGKVGLGGQDIFLAQIKPEYIIGKVSNLGAPVNGSADDFAFILNKEQTSGYFSSNREGSKGSDDLYAFSLSKPFSFGVKIKGFAENEDGELLANTKIILFDLFTGEEEIIYTNEKGEYEFIVEENKTFNIRGQKEGHFDGTDVVDTHVEGNQVTINLTLETDPGLYLYTLITDKRTNTPLNEVRVVLIDSYTSEKDTFYTSRGGEYSKAIINKRLYDEGRYSIVLEKEGYLSKRVNYYVQFDEEGEYNVNESVDLAMDPIDVGIDLSEILHIAPIYFDLGQAKIRPDAALELDKIVQVMNQNPYMVIELGSHTDSRGNKSTNLSLSDKRAKASAAYIAERITNPERITGKGYGESVPNVVDATADGGEPNQELDDEFINMFRRTNKTVFDKYHQMNRRTEFIIIEM